MTTIEVDMLAWALQYRALGLWVVPLHTPREDGSCDCPKGVECGRNSGKHPRTMHGLDDATTDEPKIRRWWGIWPHANIGINLVRSGLVDVAPDSIEWFAEFTARGLPETLRFASGGGNGHEHWLYRRSPECPAYRLTETGQYDVLSAGYAVAPPSLHRSQRRYAWINPPGIEQLLAGPTVTEPKWVREMLQAKARTRTTVSASTSTIWTPGEPPVVLEGEALERWHGRVYDINPETGEIDRSYSLWSLAVIHLEAGCSPLFVQSILAERDFALGWSKFTDRSNADERYSTIVERAAAGRGSKPITLKPHVDESEEVDDPVCLSFIPEFPVEVLPVTLRRLITASSLPTNLLVGAYLGACAAAVGGKTEAYRQSDGFSERVILFIALLAMTGAGKSPSLRQAFAPLEASDKEAYDEYRAELAAWREKPPEQRKHDKAEGALGPQDKTVLLKLTTPEAIYRRLAVQPALGLNFDELASFLKGLSRYRHHGDEDSDSALTLWEGAPLRYTRVGTGGSGGNAIDLYIDKPTVTICGGLQPYRQDLLGRDLEGLRPRWLVFLHNGMGIGEIVLPPLEAKDAYKTLIEKLLKWRNTERRWEISNEAWVRLNDLGKQWMQRAAEADDDMPSTLAALPKAIRYCVRLALLLAEVERAELDFAPGRDLVLNVGYIERARAIVDYSLAAWNALGSEASVSLSYKAAVADEAIPKILEYLARKGGGPINANILRNNNVAGIQTVGDLGPILDRYEAKYPGTIEFVREGFTKGRRKRMIRLPMRGNGPAV
jgi:hypothetical protein